MVLQPRDDILQCRSLTERHYFMEETNKICSCFGHSDVEITDELRARTSKEIDKAVADGIKNFLFGGRSDFDDLVYDIVSQKMQRQPTLGIKRIFCFPLDRDLIKPPYWFVKKEYEGYDCPPKDFYSWYTALYYRNCAMIDQSDLVLFYAEARENSGAYKAYKYAVKKHKKIVNLA